MILYNFDVLLINLCQISHIPALTLYKYRT